MNLSKELPSNNKLKKMTKNDLIALVKEYHETLDAAIIIINERVQESMKYQTHCMHLQTEMKELKKPWYKKLF